MREAQTTQAQPSDFMIEAEDLTITEQILPAPLLTDTEPAAHPVRNNTGAIERLPETFKSKGGRPRNPVAKKKFTFYLEADTDEKVIAIKKAMVRYADLLLDDKGDVVDQALALMRFCLEDEQTRATFLESYRHWKREEDGQD
jgi:hypothetical protein